MGARLKALTTKGDFDETVDSWRAADAGFAPGNVGMAWGKQIAANQIKVLCGHLGIHVPDFALIGKPTDQYQLEV